MRERIRFNEQWRFYNDDIPMLSSPAHGQSYQQAKTEHYLGGPASRLYPDLPNDDSMDGNITLLNWSYVDLPHDYIVNEPDVESENQSWGSKHYHPAWYRKHFTVSGEDRGKRLVLYFEGIADFATVYFNGCVMYRSFESHTPFEVDITDFVSYDDDNVIAIRVECGTGEGWWYQGGGIYRNVWLEKRDLLNLDRYGVFCVPKKATGMPKDLPAPGDIWSVPAEITVRNDDFTEASAEIRLTLFSPEGQEELSASKEVKIQGRTTEVVSFRETLTDPALWDVDDPKLYILRTEVICFTDTDRFVTDAEDTEIGFRTFYSDPDEGFFLNGRPLKIQGVCCHDDYGITGRAVPESVYREKARLLKEMGANAYRCSHYPQNEYWMKQADRYGILVMAEIRWFTTTEAGIRELRTLMKRDRNHPSVFLWSVGNEEPFFIKEQGARIARALYAEARKLDAVRPIITANDRDPEIATVYDYSDIVGVNYHLDILDRLHDMYPDKAILSTENSANATVRGWYGKDSKSLGKLSALDLHRSDYFLCREETWKFIIERPWLMGGMQWTGFDYRGETWWPGFSGVAGAMDLFLEKKDSFWLNQACWKKEPLVHVMPHWNRSIDFGEPVTVWVYTNCEEAELFLNGKSLGRKTADFPIHLEWQVPYEAGKLEVVGYRDGQEAARDLRETTGAPAALKLLPLNDKDIVKGDVLLLSCRAVDSEGRFVPDACPTVSFYTDRSCDILGTGSGNTDHRPAREPVREMDAGAIAVAVRTGLADGPVKVYAVSSGLQSAMFEREI